MISHRFTACANEPEYLGHSTEIEANKQYITRVTWITWILHNWSLLYDETYSQGLLSDSFSLEGMDECTCQLSFKSKNRKNVLAIEFSDSSHFLAMNIQIFINGREKFESSYLQPVPKIIYPPGLEISPGQKKNIHLFEDKLFFHRDATNKITGRFSISKIPKFQILPHQISTMEVIRSMKALYEKKTLSDVTFVIDDKELPAHKAVLAVRSEVFEAMFLSEMKEKDTSRVEIVDAKAEIFEEFLKYLYTGELNDLKNKVGEMLFLADKYQVCKLKEMCENCMLRDVCEKNVAQYLLFADKHCCVTLKKKALDILQNSVDAMRRVIMSENPEALKILKEAIAKDSFLKE
ncbi:BTB and MATH domain-containing protein 43-like [Venturia canescens]|uniref:BTB and MATH domain-containing protein 43-like n=1 Tax=Venturia canescens TaxID=32260 RepID=UPI001C9D31E5|nr:BTB and MATH domain-containing protein 43-like [Venturia canescens]